MWEERRGEVGGEKRASGRRGEKKQTRVESNTDTRGCSSAWEIHKERQGDTRGCAPETILCGTHFARFFCAMPSNTMPWEIQACSERSDRSRPASKDAVRGLPCALVESANGAWSSIDAVRTHNPVASWVRTW